MTEKKPIDSAKKIGTEVLSLLEWLSNTIRMWMVYLLKKIGSISNVAVKLLVCLALIVTCWIIWPIVMIALIVFGIVWYRRMDMGSITLPELQTNECAKCNDVSMSSILVNGLCPKCLMDAQDASDLEAQGLQETGCIACDTPLTIPSDSPFAMCDACLKYVMKEQKEKTDE